MYEWFFGDYSWINVVILSFSALLIGINKTGLPGVSLIPIILLLIFFPAKESTGLQLLMICMGDVMAVSYYRRHADWKIILRMLPWALVGIVLGSVVMRFISDSTLKPILAVILLTLVVLNYLSRGYKNYDRLGQYWQVSALFGMLVGFTTQVANAAGPIMALYLLAMRLEKTKYVGSAAWFFLILNWLKLPIFISEGRVTLSSIKADLAMIPLLLLGGFLGIVVLKKLSQTVFERFIEVIVVLGAIYMLIR